AADSCCRHLESPHERAPWVVVLLRTFPEHRVAPTFASFKDDEGRARNRLLAASRAFPWYLRHVSTTAQAGHLGHSIRIPSITRGGAAKEFGHVRAREVELVTVEGLVRRLLRVVGEELVAKALGKGDGIGALEGVNRGQRLSRAEDSITQVAGGVVREDNRPQSRITVKLEVGQNDLAAAGVAEDRDVV